MQREVNTSVKCELAVTGLVGLGLGNMTSNCEGKTL